MKYWNGYKDELESEITSEGQKWVDAAIYEGWSPREAEELGREWDRQEENDPFK